MWSVLTDHFKIALIEFIHATPSTSFHLRNWPWNSRCWIVNPTCPRDLIRSSTTNGRAIKAPGVGVSPSRKQTKDRFIDLQLSFKFYMMACLLMTSPARIIICVWTIFVQIYRANGHRIKSGVTIRQDRSSRFPCRVKAHRSRYNFHPLTHEIVCSSNALPCHEAIRRFTSEKKWISRRQVP